MAITYEWHDSHLDVRFSGHLVLQETIHALDTLVADPRLDEVNFILLDYSQVETVAYSETDFLIASHYTRTALQIMQKQKIHIAYIVEKAEVVSHLRRFISTVSGYNRNIERQIFPNREDALFWLTEIMEH